MRSSSFWAVTQSRLITDVSVQTIVPSPRIKQPKKNPWRAKFSGPFFLIVCCRSEGLATPCFTSGETDSSRPAQGIGDWVSLQNPPDTLEGEKSLIPPETGPLHSVLQLVARLLRIDRYLGFAGKEKSVAWLNTPGRPWLWRRWQNLAYYVTLRDPTSRTSNTGVLISP